LLEEKKASQIGTSEFYCSPNAAGVVKSKELEGLEM
jgi:hypothetical protein